MTTKRAEQDADGGDTAGVIARPPLLFLGALLLGFVLDHLLPLPFEVPRGGEIAHRLIPGALILGGLALAVAGIRNFSRGGTPVPTNEPTRVLVTGGVHAWSRNPIYLGLFLIYAGIGVVVGSEWILLLIVPLALTMCYGVVMREEAYLERRFGDTYRDYMTRVRRWL